MEKQKKSCFRGEHSPWLQTFSAPQSFSQTLLWPFCRVQVPSLTFKHQESTSMKIRRSRSSNVTFLELFLEVRQLGLGRRRTQGEEEETLCSVGTHWIATYIPLWFSLWNAKGPSRGLHLNPVYQYPSHIKLLSPNTNRWRSGYCRVLSNHLVLPIICPPCRGVH